MSDKLLDRQLGLRLRALRAHQGLSLGALADRSGVSKAMIARVEKAQSSATAALLGRLCSGLGVRLSSLIEAADRNCEQLSRLREQPVWRDPETGYVRRQISPPAASSGLDIAEITLPPGKRVPYRAWSANAYQQQLLMLEGKLNLQIGDENLCAGQGRLHRFRRVAPECVREQG